MDNMLKIPSFRSFLLLSSLLFFTGNVSAQDNDRAFETAKNISIFNSVLKELNTLYVDTFDLDKMVEKGINTMLYTLDPYTTYIPETETEDFKFMTTGEYGGIGSLITYRDSFTYIAEPYEGLPAQLSGLKAGDKILRVDSVSAVGLPSDKVSERLKGPRPTRSCVSLWNVPIRSIHLLSMSSVKKSPCRPYPITACVKAVWIYLSAKFHR